MLLHWVTLQPQGPSNLAAIRFSSPIIVHKIRIFPFGEQLFENEPSITSETTESHQMRRITIFFTATPLPTEADPKPKASNALVSTEMYYADGLWDYPVDLGAYSTRVMTIKTSTFPRITIAVYGELVTSPLSSVMQSPTPSPIASSAVRPLPAHLDPAHVSDPTSIARGLWDSLGPPCSNVALLHVLRLMFALTARNEDWDIGGYPEYFADLSPIDAQGDADDWIEEIMERLRIPVWDQEDPRTVQDFGESVRRALNGDLATVRYSYATHFVMFVAKQGPEFAREVLRGLDLLYLLEYEVDYETRCRNLESIRQYCANPAIAQQLRDQGALHLLDRLIHDHPRGRKLRGAAQALAERIAGWHELTEAMGDPSVPWGPSLKWIREITADETSFALFLIALRLQEPFSRIIKSGVRPETQLLAFWPNQESREANLEERRAFLKALVGIGMVLPVFCWTNSEGMHDVLKKTLALFRVWQLVDGYREILNHLLSLHQCTWRLERSVTDQLDSITTSAEQLLYNLYKGQPMERFLADYAIKLPQQTTLTVSESHWFLEAGKLHAYGIRRAVGLLLGSSAFRSSLSNTTAIDPMDVAGAADLLVRLLQLIEEFIREEGEQNFLDEMWNYSSDASSAHGVVPSLVDVLSLAIGCLHEQSRPTTPRTIDTETMDNLYIACAAALRLLIVFCPMLPPLTRELRSMTEAVVTLRVLCSLSERRNAVESADHVTKAFFQATVEGRFGEGVTDTVVQTVLEQAAIPSGLDLELEFREAASTVEGFLVRATSAPTAEVRARWAARIMADLPLLGQFLHRLTPHERARQIGMLRLLDEKKFGLGEHFLIEEWKVTVAALDALRGRKASSTTAKLLHQQVAIGFECALACVREHQEWTMSLFVSGNIAGRIGNAYSMLSMYDLHISAAAELGKELIKANQKGLKVCGLCALLRMARAVGGRHTASMQEVASVLKHIGTLPPEDVERLVYDLGLTMTAYARKEIELSDSQNVEAIAQLLDWVTRQTRDSPIPTLSEISFDALQALASGVADSFVDDLTALRDELLFSDDEPMEQRPLVVDAENFHMTLGQMKEALDERVTKTPSTPIRKTSSHPALGLVAVSPPVTRSPLLAASLTKTYTRDEFRQLRNVPSSRQNTSRPPSTHVDEFNTTSPPMATNALSVNSSPLLPVHPFATSPQLPTVPFMTFPPPP